MALTRACWARSTSGSMVEQSTTTCLARWRGRASSTWTTSGNSGTQRMRTSPDDATSAMVPRRWRRTPRPRRRGAAARRHGHPMARRDEVAGHGQAHRSEADETQLPRPPFVSGMSADGQMNSVSRLQPNMSAELWEPFACRRGARRPWPRSVQVAPTGQRVEGEGLMGEGPVARQRGLDGHFLHRDMTADELGEHSRA